MTVMVIGGNGFLGSHLMRELIKRGIKPVSFDPSPVSYLNQDLEEQFIHVPGDAFQLSSIIHALQAHQVEHIVHLSSLVTLASQKNPELAYRLNVGTLVNTLEAARVIKAKRVLYASSLGAYGETPPDEPVKEDRILQPVSLYGWTKVFGEKLAEAYRQDYGLDIVSVRFPAMWGPGQAMAGKSAKTGSGRFSDIIEKPARGEAARITCGSQKYDLLYVKDSRRLVISLLLADKLSYTEYNAGSGRMITLEDIKQEVVKHLPEAQIELEPGYDYFSLPCQGPMDLSRSARDVGYKPEYDVAAAVRDYLDYLF